MTGYTGADALVETEWLAAHLGDVNVRILDASHHVPTTGRNGRAEYDAEHIPGAGFFDIDAVCDRSSDLPHMLPDTETFAAALAELGIEPDTQVIVYDTVGATGAARAWWTFRVFGHDNVAVLNGSLRKWKAEDRPVTAEVPRFPAVSRRTLRRDDALVRSLEQVRDNIEAQREQVVDARSAGRFAGTETEPRQGLRSGHIPGSLNLPFPALFREDGTLRPAEQIRAAIEQAGVDLNRPVVTTCGSGVTASSLALGFYLIGRPDIAVYDGSWSEWGGRADLPVATSD